MRMTVLVEVEVPDDSAYAQEALKAGSAWEKEYLDRMAQMVGTDCLDGMELVGQVTAVKVSLTETVGEYSTGRHRSPRAVGVHGLGFDPNDVDLMGLVSLLMPKLNADGRVKMPDDVNEEHLMHALRMTYPGIRQQRMDDGVYLQI